LFSKVSFIREKGKQATVPAQPVNASKNLPVNFPSSSRCASPRLMKNQRNRRKKGKNRAKVSASGRFWQLFVENDLHAFRRNGPTRHLST
jgi:hypothetical protein